MAIGIPGLGALSWSADRVARTRLETLEARLAELEGEGHSEREAVREKLSHGGMVTRREAAAFLSVSTKKIQRMDAAGVLPRCPGLGAVVRYAARDVLRFSSAFRKVR